MRSTGVGDRVGAVRQRLFVERGDVLRASSSVRVGKRVLATGPRLLVSILSPYRIM